MYLQAILILFTSPLTFPVSGPPKQSLVSSESFDPFFLSDEYEHCIGILKVNI